MSEKQQHAKQRARLRSRLARVEPAERLRLLDFFAWVIESEFGPVPEWIALRCLPGGGDDSRQAFGGERAYRAAAGE